MRSPRILVVDRTDDLAAQVHEVADDLRPRPEVVTCERVAALSDALEEDEPFEVVIAGPSTATASGLAQLEKLRLDQRGLSLVLMFTKRPNADLRDIVRTGASDVLKLPADDQSMRGVIEQAIDLARRRSVSKEAAPRPEPRRKGKLLTVASASGGSGKTFFATNLAYFLHNRTGRSTCIVDLDLEFGQVASVLRLRGESSVVDAVEKLPGDDADVGALVREHLVTHETGVDVLAAPKDPSDADRVQPDQAIRLFEVLRGEFDYLVVDTPPALAETTLAVYDLTDELFVMATLDVPSLRAIGAFTGTLEKLGVPPENVKLVLNKAEPDVGIDVEQLDKLFPGGFAMTLPYTSQVTKSVNLGTPILAYAPKAPISRQLADGLERLLEGTAEGDPSGSRPNAAPAGELNGVRAERSGIPPLEGLLSKVFRRSTPARARSERARP
ncbi:MAG TPA: P-loop NTPase [Acidimicrobiales bacterium]|nr:P-loop NTPase [Acidimicrobiales bacterium]